jgi:hypothetical protein
MKTPREILLQRHRQAQPKLDEARRKVLTQLSATASAEAPTTPPNPRGLILASLNKAWMELIWPSRRAWAGMAVLWFIVALANMEMKMSVQGLPRARSATVRELAQGLQEQRRLLSELLQTTKTPLANPPHPNPSPRSERQLNLRSC